MRPPTTTHKHSTTKHNYEFASTNFYKFDSCEEPHKRLFNNATLLVTTNNNSFYQSKPVFTNFFKIDIFSSTSSFKTKPPFWSWLPTNSSVGRHSKMTTNSSVGRQRYLLVIDHLLSCPQHATIPTRRARVDE